MSREKVHDDAYDSGAKLCGHAPRSQRAHYLGGGLWVCFECLAKLVLGGRYTPPLRREVP